MTMPVGTAHIITGRGDMHRHKIVAGSVSPKIKFKFQKEDGTYWNLTSATGTFTLVKEGGALAINAAALTIEADDTESEGEITWDWSTAAPSIPGLYRAEVVVTPNGESAQPIFEIVEVIVRKKLSA